MIGDEPFGGVVDMADGDVGGADIEELLVEAFERLMEIEKSGLEYFDLEWESEVVARANVRILDWFEVPVPFLLTFVFGWDDSDRVDRGDDEPPEFLLVRWAVGDVDDELSHRIGAILLDSNESAPAWYSFGERTAGQWLLQCESRILWENLTVEFLMETLDVLRQWAVFAMMACERAGSRQWAGR